MQLAEVRTTCAAILDEVERAVVGKRDAARARPARPARRRPRPDRGLPGPGEDARSTLVRADDEHGLLPRPVHARPDALGRDRLIDLEPARRRLRVPLRPDLHQPPARRRDQPRPTEDAGGAARGDAGAPGDDRRRHPLSSSRRSSSSRRRTRSSTRARTRCPRRSSTASCSGSGSATRSTDEEWQVLAQPAGARAPTRPSSARSSIARRCSRSSARWRASTSASRSAATSSRSLNGDAGERSAAVGASPRGSARAAEALALPRRPGRPRLRHARRREGGRGARARTPDDAPARALGPAPLR